MRTGSIYRGEQCLLPVVWYAANPWTRLRGLLGRKPLDVGEALLIEPCSSVHTFGMRYALDLVFLDRRNCVVDVRENVAPWKVSGARARARKTLELKAGGLVALAPRIGEEFSWRAH